MRSMYQWLGQSTVWKTTVLVWAKRLMIFSTKLRLKLYYFFNEISRHLYAIEKTKSWNTKQSIDVFYSNYISTIIQLIFIFERLNWIKCISKYVPIWTIPIYLELHMRSMYQWLGQSSVWKTTVLVWAKRLMIFSTKLRLKLYYLILNTKLELFILGKYPPIFCLIDMCILTPMCKV
jgi:hypothetical protein